MVVRRHFQWESGDDEELIEDFVDAEILFSGSLYENTAGVLTFAVGLGFVYGYCSENYREKNLFTLPKNVLKKLKELLKNGKPKLVVQKLHF